MAAPKVLEVLQLFTVDAPRWRVERIAARMGVSTSTAYRCVADLVRIGLLQPVSGGAYVLGPAFTELDLRMRLSDPLLRAARPHMAQLRDVLGREYLASRLAAQRSSVASAIALYSELAVAGGGHVSTRANRQGQ